MSNCDNETILAAVAKALEHKTHFYCYRLPTEEQLHFGAQVIEQHTPVGFFIHPFSETVDTPTSYISAQFDARKFMKIPLSAMPLVTCRQINEQTTSKEEYLDSVNRCIQSIDDGTFQKIVISRAIVNDYSIISWQKVFKKLLDKNPDAFVFIFHSEEAGFWIGASPEKYLSFRNNQISTMALAGTRTANTETPWEEKEINEQQIVVDYISEKFDKVGVKYELSDRYTRHAGTIEHLCNDFNGTINTPSQVDKLRTYLHPTPALAGVPTKKAVKFIMQTESHKRRYYGGYIGPVDDRGNFDFYVNLRSLEFDSERYCIYAGGGITSESIPEKEWEETIQKSQNLLNIL